MPTLKQIADLLAIPCPTGLEAREVSGVRSLEQAGPAELSVVSGDKYVGQYKKTRAGTVLISRKIKFPVRPDVAALVVDDADLALVKVLGLLSPPVPRPAKGIHPAALIDPAAVIDSSAAIGANVFVGAGATIGANTQLHPGVYVGDNAVVGGDCVIWPNVVIRERVRVGSRVIIHPNCVLGADGFGYRWDGKEHVKIPQIGDVIIEDDVEIGACVCIDRAKFDETRVGRGTKIDNLVQIAHNVRIGQHSIICGQVGIAGTVTIGNGVVIGGASVLRDHITVADGVTAAGHSVVAEDVEAKSIISGMPALPHRQTLREQASIRRLPEVIVEIRKLQEELARLREKIEPLE